MERKFAIEVYKQHGFKKLLSIEDNLEIGKFKFWVVYYGDDFKATRRVFAYVNIDDVRGALASLENMTFPKVYTDGLEIYGGGGDPVMSRVLRVTYEEVKSGKLAGKMGFVVKITNGPGERLGKGGVKPTRGADREEGAFVFSIAEAQNMAANVIDYWQAWQMRNLHVLYNEEGKKRPNLREAKIA